MSKENLYRTAAYVTAFSVAEKAFGFLYRIILSRTLDSEGVGLYQVALSVFAVLATAAASGIPMTVSRLITKYRARNNRKAQQSVVAAALAAADRGFEETAGGVRLVMEDAAAARAFLQEYPALCDDFEFRKGDMDDVFLAVTGRRAEGGGV